MVLHTLSTAPDNPAFAQCLQAAGGDDTILLLGDGVYAALPGSTALAELQQHPARVCVLGRDAGALGLQDLPGDITSIDMAGFVALTEACPRQLAWY